MSYLKFKGIQDFGESTVTDELSYGLQAWMNNAFLEIGAYTNVNLPTSGAYGGAFHILRAVSDPNYVDGQVFESPRSNWVYESGIDYQPAPIQISGIFVNGTYYSTSTTGTYAYSLNYPLGRVTFGSAIPTSSVVTAAHSYRYVNVYTSNTPWFQRLQFNSLRPDQGFEQSASGTWDILAQSRVQLPAVVIEPSPRFKLVGKELGSNVQERYQDVLIHVLAEEPWTRNKVADILSYQKNNTIYTFDYAKVVDSGVYVLDAFGGINPSGLPYPTLVSEANSNYRNNFITINEIGGQEIANEPPLYRCVLRYNCWTETP
jgi:hypothetical protein